MEELKPCPWCGKSPKSISDGEYYCLECPWDKCPSNQTFRLKEEAIKAWNTRSERSKGKK